MTSFAHADMTVWAAQQAAKIEQMFGKVPK